MVRFCNTHINYSATGININEGIYFLNFKFQCTKTSSFSTCNILGSEVGDYKITVLCTSRRVFCEKHAEVIITWK